MSTHHESRNGDMRVLLFADAFQDYVMELAAALSTRVPLALACPSSWTTDPDFHRLELTDCLPFDLPRIRDPRSLTAHRRVMASLAAFPADMIHLQSSANPWANIALASTTFRTPVVQTVHDPLHHPGDRETKRLGHRSMRWSRRRCTRYITHTAGQAELLHRAWRLPAERVDVVAHGELGSRFRRARATETERESRTVLFFGRRWPYKGLDVLIDALNLLPATTEVTRLIIAGKGEPLGPHLDRLDATVEVEIEDGFIEQHRVTELFDRATVLALPYREASQSGVAAIGLGLGVPIVASAVGGLREVLRPDVDAIVVPPGSASALSRALGTIFDDPELRDRLAANAQARAAADLSWDAVAERTIAVYEATRP